MSDQKKFKLWGFRQSSVNNNSHPERKRSLRFEELEDRRLLSVSPTDFGISRDTYPFRPAFEQISNQTFDEDNYPTAADTLMSRLKGYGTTWNVSPIRCYPMTYVQYLAGAPNAAVGNPSLTLNGTYSSVFVVDTLLDIINPNDGLVSLREAIIAANTFAGHDLITFAPGLTGTIYLCGTALPTITDSVNIEGPGSDLLTIDAGGKSRIFNICPEDPNVNAPIPSKPGNFYGFSLPSGNGITLEWDASSDATGYAIYRYSGSNWTLVDVTDETSFTDIGLVVNNVYQYFIIAINKITGNMSTPSATVNVTTQSLPDIPTNLTATAVSATQINVSWSAVPGATSYKIYRRDGNLLGFSNIDDTSGTAYTDTFKVEPNTKYDYYIVAVNASGESSPAPFVTVTTPPAFWIDIDIDSFNTSRFAGPSRTQAEDDIEDDPNHFGKIIRPNYGDADNDGVLDIWDGYTGGGQFQSGANCSEQFVPIVVEIPEWIDLANATFQFDYWQGSTTMTGYTPGSPPRFGDGNIRIWTKDGTEARSGNSIHLGGNLVMDGMSYTAQQLGFIDTDRSITLYVEGHSVSSSLGNREIIVSMDYDFNGHNVHVEDRVKYTVQEDAGWWIESVEWVTNPYGNELFDEWTGISVYADKDTPDASNQWTFVDVVVTIGGTVPVGGGVVTLVCIDPENASVPRTAGQEDMPDNYDGIGIFHGTRTISVGFTHGGPMTQTVTATVGTHAGDNYSLLAYPSSCEPEVESEVLTVWRRLWVELDRMKNPDEGTDIDEFDPGTKYTLGASGDRGDITKNQWMEGNADTRPGNPPPPVGPIVEPMDFDVKFQPPLPSLTRATEHFAAACVLVQGISSEQVKQWSGNTQLEEPDFQKYLEYGVSIPPLFVRPDVAPGRDIDASTNTDDFWILHALGAYNPGEYESFDSNISGTFGYAQPNGTILIYQEAIRDYMTTAYKYTPNLIASLVDVSEARSRTMYHELLHYFVGGHWDNGQSPVADVGIMDKNTNSTTFNLFITADIELTPLQIASIQVSSKPETNY